MTAWLFVAIGGALGACARFGVSRGLAAAESHLPLPIATLVVNVVGCFAIGWVATHYDLRGSEAQIVRALVVFGFLGGFTTYSAFGMESLGMWQRGAPGPALAHVALHLALGLGAVWAGATLAR